jgi:hypothetical protein
MTGTLHEDFLHLRYLAKYFFELEMFYTEVVEKIQTHN